MNAGAMTRRGVLGVAAVLSTRSLVHAGPQTSERRDLESVFADHQATGCFAMYAPDLDALTVVNAARAARRLVPASTFKLANSLIALETGVIRDENEIIPFGGKPQSVKAWERDMSIREAIAASNVPIYQELARRIGLERYAAYLARLDYGNRQTGPVVDRFWLDGPLAISAVEQAGFAARLALGKLDVSARAQAIVRDIVRQESRNGATLFGKTGWAYPGPPAIGWWVGWVERGARIHAVALNIDMAEMAAAAKRLAIIRSLCERLDVY